MSAQLEGDAFPVARAPLRWVVAPVGVAFAGYWGLLSVTPAAGGFALPGLLAVSWVPFLLALAQAVRAKRRRAMLDVPPSQWRDGETVGVFGQLDRGTGPLTAPVSGEPACAYSWELRRRRQKGLDTVFGHGTMLASAILDTVHGPLSLRGVPTLDMATTPDRSDAASRARLARHVLSNAVRRQLDDALPATEVQALLARERPGTGRNPDAAGRLAYAFARPAPDGPLSAASLWRRAEAAMRTDAAGNAEQNFAEALQHRLYRVVETRIPVDAPVCAYGTWDATARCLDIGPSPTGRHHALIGRDAAQERRASRIGAAVLVMLSLLFPGAANVVVGVRVMELLAAQRWL